MFDIGFLELLLIGVVGLLVLGPERLPKAARTLGLWIGKIKRTVSGMQREISAQLEAEELRQKLNEQQKKLDESLNQARRGVEGVAEPTRPSAASSSSKPPAEGDPASPPGEGERREGSGPLERLDDALARKGGRASAAEETPAAPQDSATSRAKDSSAP
ncbi:Sec-independent protein translocase protein TatB [Halomonas sp. NCCP-2165]|nr:Sec-independent protein translocase protein TatB [Halomonas sp. NCCP-2165]GKW50773.1 sec-independent protein translocase protein TatB [Halomonas sp. NCCP-2165]